MTIEFRCTETNGFHDMRITVCCSGDMQSVRKEARLVIAQLVYNCGVVSFNTNQRPCHIWVMKCIQDESACGFNKWSWD
jgi:hypothetical protein